ncbi:retaining alpha-galactosidase [Abditibacteriota bacterium]|nr:retaining alpha-galactosidase [Abditibacteriota bacterium]
MNAFIFISLPLVLTGGFLCEKAQAKPLSFRSPDKRLQLFVDSNANGLTYSLNFNKQQVLAPSQIGITVDGNNLGQNAMLGEPRSKNFRETYATRGVHSLAVNQYREILIPVSTGPSKTPWQLEWRLFNDGVAYRYRVPEVGSHLINGESSAWQFPTGSTIWYQDNKRYAYESPIQTADFDTFNPPLPLMAPATIKLPGLGYAMLTEANLIHYSDMALQPNSSHQLQAFFHHDQNGWSQDGEILSPWRVTLFSPDLNGLVNSDIITNLCPPPSPKLTNAKWIVPGRSTWHWMVTGGPRLEAQHQWVDWTKQLGFEYYLIDEGWSNWQRDGLDQWACLKEVVDYARSQGVGIWAWVHTKEVTKPSNRLAYFKKAKEIGLVGLKIDFMGPPNAVWVQWYDDTLRDAAATELMVDFHGAVKPTGRERTWPNELTREAIRGREMGKLSGLHDTTLPFLRFVQGPADYTPTDFRTEKLRGSSWARELAQAIVYTSPFLCLSGDPANYLANPSLDLLKALPPTWDETIVLPGSEIGQTAAFARRKGQEWFIGIVNGHDARSFPISLQFLGKGSYQMDKLADSPERGDAFNRTQNTVKSSDSLGVALRSEGGFVAHLRPLTR